MFQVFFYEYTDEALPAHCPRQCLPYAVLTYKRPKHCAPVDHLSLKSAYRNIFRSGKDRGESAPQGSLAGEETSSYSDTTPERYRVVSQHSRHKSGETDPRLSSPGTLIGRGRGAPLLPDPPLNIQEGSTLDSGPEDYQSPGLQSTAVYRRPLLQTPLLASATSDTSSFEGGLPPAAQRFGDDPRLALRSSQNCSVGWSGESYGDQDRPLVMTSPPADQVTESSYCSIANASQGVDMNTAAHANGLSSTGSQAFIHSGISSDAPSATATGIPPEATLHHVNVSKVQESLTESQVAMLKQALNTSQVVSPVNLLSQQVTGEELMSSGPIHSVIKGHPQLHSPVQKPKTGKQKLSLELYRQKKRKASSGQSANLSSDDQNSGQCLKGSAVVLQQQQLTSDSVPCVEESR